MRLLGLLAAATLLANDANPPARFTDPRRAEKLQSAMPEVDRIFRDFAAARKIPGLVWGVVIDGRLAHFGATGVQSRETGAAPTADTVFRIASMTKSFTALAILKLRDEGKLSLEDPVGKWIPEFNRMPLPTRDSAPLRIRHLLSHSGGLPEDNPWGDQQLGVSDAQLDQWLRAGIPFSTPPGSRFEYSNYGFGLLGRIVTKASGRPYEQYVTSEILQKLGMSASTLESARVPAARRAVGYRLKPDGTYAEEPPLPHGAFGAMGGLLTSANDLAGYVAFHLSAWPPRDEPESGPVRRSSVREMSQPWTSNMLVASQAGGRVRASQTSYGFGLSVITDCRFGQSIGHGGGLPGYGSYMQWLPEYGVGIFAMATLTYAGPARPIGQAFEALDATGGLQRREAPPSPALAAMQPRLWELWQHWDDAKAKQIAAMNLFLDAPIPQRRAQIDAVKAAAGACSAAGPVMPENWLRGQFNLTCANGPVGVFFTLAPTQPPLIQHLEFRKLAAPGERMVAPTGPPAGANCTQ